MSYFVPNPVGIAEIKLLPGTVEVMLFVAEGLAEEARLQFEAQGPHPYSDSAPPTFSESIQADAGIEGDSAVGRAYTDVEYAPYIEFGTVDTPEFQPFRLALDAFHL